MKSLTFEQSTYAPFMKTTMVSLNNGIDLCVEVGGNPEHPAVLLIMGLGCQMLHWPNAFVSKLIEQGFYVVRFDNRDIGLSTKIKRQKPLRRSASKKTIINKDFLKLLASASIGRKSNSEFIPYHISDMAEDVVLLIDALGLKQPHIIGGSMGGMVAQIVAAKYPDKINKLGLLFSSNLKAFLPLPYPKQLKSLLKRPKSNSEDAIVNHSAYILKTIGSEKYYNDDYTKTMTRLYYQRSYYPMGYVHQLLAVMACGSLVKYNKKIKTPTIIVHGEKDRLLPPKHGKSLAKSIKGSKYIEIPDMGHDIPNELIDALVIHFSNHFKKSI